MTNRKRVTERDLLAFLEEGRLQFPPLQLTEVETEAPAPLRTERLDALITLSWGDQAYRFVVETKSRWTPKAIASAAEQVRAYGDLTKRNPLILVPYLDNSQILELEARRISGIDLCGNGIVVVPEKLLVLRTGSPNQFRWEGAIKNVYRKNSSVVARLFLLVPEFDSVKDALKELRRRGSDVTSATISKVCKALEDDLVLERQPGNTPTSRRLRLLQPEKLLNSLASNYVPPDIARTVRGKCRLPWDALRERLAMAESNSNAMTILTGASSVNAYAVMAREPTQTFYCTDVDKVLATIGGDFQETDRFENVVLQQTRDEIVYFDRRPGWLASPIQAYLELARGDKRERETAEQVRRIILEPRDKA